MIKDHRKPYSLVPVHTVRSAWTMSPAHPSVKCFFSDVKQLFDVRPHIWGWLCLKEPWFRRFRQLFRSRRNIENCCENKVQGLSSARKIYQARTLCLNMTQHCLSEADFTASKERQQWKGNCPSAKTMALKSGMTLTYWIVHNRHTTIKIPPIFWDLFQSSTWPREWNELFKICG